MPCTRISGLRKFFSSALIASSLSAPAQAKAPEQDSYDWSEMQPYIQFIQVMDYCCSIADGRIPFDQQIKSEKVIYDPVTNSDRIERVYRVFMLERSFVTKDPNDEDSSAYRLLFKKRGETHKGEFGMWVEVPHSNVISRDNALKRCKPIIAQNEALRAINPKAPLHTCNPPIVPILWLRKDGYPYCFWPEEKLGALKPPPGLRKPQFA